MWTEMQKVDLRLFFRSQFKVFESQKSLNAILKCNSSDFSPSTQNSMIEIKEFYDDIRVNDFQ